MPTRRGGRRVTFAQAEELDRFESRLRPAVEVSMFGGAEPMAGWCTIAVKPLKALEPTSLQASRLTILLVCVLGCLACDSRAVVDGKLIAPADRPEAVCKVELHDEAGDPGAGLRCHETGATNPDPDTAVVRVGQTFECTVVAIEGAVDVTVSCDGYELYRSPAFRWSGEGSGPQAHHLGDIVLKPETDSR
jgi:hypothetical protein